MEQWSRGRSGQSTEVDKAANVWQGRIATIKGTGLRRSLMFDPAGPMKRTACRTNSAGEPLKFPHRRQSSFPTERLSGGGHRRPSAAATTAGNILSQGVADGPWQAGERRA